MLSQVEVSDNSCCCGYVCMVLGTICHIFWRLKRVFWPYWASTFTSRQVCHHITSILCWLWYIVIDFLGMYSHCVPEISDLSAQRSLCLVSIRKAWWLLYTNKWFGVLCSVCRSVFLVFHTVSRTSLVIPRYMLQIRPLPGCGCNCQLCSHVCWQWNQTARESAMGRPIYSKHISWYKLPLILLLHLIILCTSAKQLKIVFGFVGGGCAALCAGALWISTERCSGSLY